MLGVEPVPAREDLVRVAQLGSGRCAAVLHEERVRSPAQLEICRIHGGEASG